MRYSAAHVNPAGPFNGPSNDGEVEMKLVLVWVGLLCVSAPAFAQKEAAPPAVKAPPTVKAPPAPMTLSGPAHNVSLGLDGALSLRVTQTESVYAATGSFSGLFGLIEASGRVLGGCAPEHQCLLFAGAIKLDPKNGGWPAGTGTTFTLHVDILPGGTRAVGVYHIGPLEGFDHPQYGTVELKVGR